jgi:hypothetical protein
LVVGEAGATWYYNDSAERITHRFPDGSRRVVYKDRFYLLQPAARLVEVAEEQFARNGAMMIGGKGIQPFDADRSFQSYDFIDITPTDEHERARRMFAEAADRAAPKVGP